MAANILAPLRYRDFRLLWTGLMISNLGTWMQFTAMGYFVSQMAGTPHRAALYLGFIGAARAVPVLLLSPVAGVIADTKPRRAVLMIANAVMALCALVLAVLATLHVLDLTMVIAISAINAAGMAFDSPVRQSWTPQLVDRPYVGNAIGLVSVAFNAPSVLGPAIAGLTIVWVGVAGSFYINAVATLAVVVAIAMMAPSKPSGAKPGPILQSIVQGFAFLIKHPILRYVTPVFIITALLVRPYFQLIPAYVINALHGDARALGYAVAAAGIGGFGGALVTAAFSGRRSLQWLIGGVQTALGVMLLGFIYSVPLSLPVFFLIGVGTLAFLGATNTLIQTLAPDDMRGRAVSVYTMIAIGVVPGGSLVVGSIAAVLGLHLTFIIAGAICAASVLAAYVADAPLRTV